MSEFNDNIIKDNSLDEVQKSSSIINFVELQSEINSNEKNRLDELYRQENKRKRSLLFYVGIVYFCLILLLIGVRILSNMGIFNALDYILEDYVSSSIIQLLIMFSIPLFAFSFAKKQKIKQTFKDFKFKKIKGGIVILSICIGILVFWLNGFISSIFSFLINLFGYESVPVQSSDTEVNTGSFWYIITTIICSCILPAICEETAHRGMLFTTLKRYGVGKAILISGIMFGLIHLSVNQFFYASVIGCFLAFLTVISDSIYPAMIVHFMNNFLSTCSELLYVNGYEFFNISNFLNYLDTIFGEWLANFLIFMFLIICVCLVIYLTYLIYKKRKYNHVVEKIKKENFAFFYNFENLGENGNLKLGTLENFFGTNNVEFASLLYLFDNSKRNENKKLLNYFEDVYNADKGKGVFDWTFIISAICMGAIVTIFTFIWGVL